MKYLKLFENYDEDDPQYKEISSDEYDAKCSGDEYSYEEESRYISEAWEEWEISEVQKIDNLFTDYSNYYRYHVEIDYLDNKELPQGRLSIKGIPFEENKIELEETDLTVIKLRDEYFCVYDVTNMEYYLCDQFDGLMDCLENVRTM